MENDYFVFLFMDSSGISVSFFLFLGLGFLFRLVYVGRLKGEVYLGGFRIREGYGGKGIFSLVSLG